MRGSYLACHHSSQDEEIFRLPGFHVCVCVYVYVSVYMTMFVTVCVCVPKANSVQSEIL